MSGMFLSVAVENADFMIPRGIRELAAGALSRHTHIHQLCTYFRQRGVARLLLEGEPEGYYLNAMQSASAFLFELGRAADAVKVTSFARPFFDALSAGYWDAALRMVSLSRTSWNPDYEYEDDFLYVFFLMQLLAAQPSAQLLPLLERYALVLDGAADVRLDICRALLDRDESAFDAELRSWLRQRRTQADALAEGSSMKAETAAWVQNFALEGCALIKLAERIGLDPAHDFLHCPDLIRADAPYTFDPQAWAQLNITP